jgi:hypothetical protein
MYIFLDVCTSRHILPTAFVIHQVAAGPILAGKIIVIVAYTAI